MERFDCLAKNVAEGMYAIASSECVRPAGQKKQAQQTIYTFHVHQLSVNEINSSN